MDAELPEAVAEVFDVEPEAGASARPQLGRQHEVEVIRAVVRGEAGAALDGADLPDAVAFAGDADLARRAVRAHAHLRRVAPVHEAAQRTAEAAEHGRHGALASGPIFSVDAIISHHRQTLV